MLLPERVSEYCVDFAGIVATSLEKTLQPQLDDAGKHVIRTFVCMGFAIRLERVNILYEISLSVHVSLAIYRFRCFARNSIR